MSLEVPDGWRSTTLGEMADITGGSTPSKAEPMFWEGGTVPWATPSDVTRLPPGTLALDGQVSSFVTAKAISQTSLRVLPVGSVLMTSRATIGFPAINSVPVATNQGFANFLPNPSYDPHFLAQWIIYNRSILENAAGGSTFLEISKKTLRGLRIDLPPPAEQRRIAEILSSVDETIRATQALIEQTRKVKEGVLERLFRLGLGQAEIKATEIGDIPAKWKVLPLSNLCSSITVGIASSATHAYQSDGVALIRNQNIKAGYLDMSDLLWISDEFDKQYASKRVMAGDVITMRTGYPGKSAVIPPKWHGSQTFTTLISRPIQSLILPEFLCYWINSDGGMKEVRKRQAGGAQQNLNAGVLKQLPIPVPSIEEQAEIVRFVSAFPESANDGALEQLVACKQGLMLELLTGRRRVSSDLPLAAE